jgi:hypothetical protein
MGMPTDFDRNSIEYSVQITQIAKRESYEEYVDVVDELRYNVILSCEHDGQPYTKTIFRVSHFDLTQMNQFLTGNFIPFDWLNKEVYNNWIYALIEREGSLEGLKDQAIESWFPSRVYINV